MEIQRLSPDSPAVWFERIAEIHKMELDEGFLSSLGTRFLRSLYRNLAGSPEAFLLAAVRDKRVLGFICGATDTRKVYRRFFVRGGLLAAIYLAPKLFSRQRVRRVFETLLYPSRSRGLELPTPEILSFCVSRTCQRLGVGKRLFAELAAEFRRRGVPSIRIVTGQHQRAAQRFYESLGAERRAEIEVHDGTTSLVYVYRVPPDDLPAARQAA